MPKRKKFNLIGKLNAAKNKQEAKDIADDYRIHLLYTSDEVPLIELCEWAWKKMQEEK